MLWYEWLLYASLALCLISLIFHLIRLIKLGKPADLSEKAGNTSAAVRYSFTGAMSPKKKESAYLHLPTYTAGLVYHFGTFLSIALFVLILLQVSFVEWLNLSFIIFLIISSVAGFGILIKRIRKKSLRSLSNPDDYISNILVSLIQLFTAIVLYDAVYLPYYYVLMSLLLLYIPMGKLKHLLYFFAARYHLGMFFGWRGVWPPKKLKA